MVKGVIAGNFDIIHPGYIKMFKEAKQHCDSLIILLHIDPSIERPEKLKPILTKEERTEVLSSIKFIDSIAYYTYEDELVKLIKDLEPDIRFLGDDYKNKSFTGDDLQIPIYYLNRDHGWSTTKFKKLILQSTYKLKQAYITHTTDNYEQITINLVNSIRTFSNKPIVVYTIDYTATDELQSMATCIRLDLDLPEISGDDFLGEDIKYVNRSTYRTYKALSSKIDCMLHACGFIEEWVYLDGDCIANHNVDDLFNWCGSANEYPLATKGPHQYLLLVKKGELIGNPFVDDTIDLTKCLEWPLMNYFGMDVNQRSTEYRTTNILVGSNKNKEFLETWRMHKEVLPTKVDPVKFMPYHEETIYNVLVWQRTNRGLPMVYINVEGPETVDHFFNTTTEDDVLISEFYKLPQHKKDIKVFHGEKRKEQADIIIKNIRKYAFSNI